LRGKIWEAFESDEQPVLLIDEIDKADIEFPNDLLRELDRMEFYVYETKKLVEARHRPIIVITSNNEKELPDAFLRRCFFHYIKFPDQETMTEIVDVHFPNLKKDLLAEASCSTGSSYCSPRIFRLKSCAAKTAGAPYRRCMGHC
jgi:MoxR-like ATPase